MASLEAIGYPTELTVDQWREIATRPIRDVYSHLAGIELDSDQWCALEEAWVDNYLVYYDQVDLNPTCLQALEAVAQAGMTQSIISLTRESQLRENVDSLGITDWFTHISGSRQSWNGEHPSKAAEVHRQLADLGVDHSQVVMVGDMIDDAREAKEAGVSAILVSTGDTSRQRLLDSGHTIADSLISAVAMMNT